MRVEGNSRDSVHVEGITVIGARHFHRVLGMVYIEELEHGQEDKP